MKIREMMAHDWPVVRTIYQEGIDTGLATFETEIPTWEYWHDTHLQAGRLVAEDETSMLGWAALTAVSHRCVYGGVAEVSIYIANAARGQGVGTALLNALIRCSEDENLWTLQATILGGNDASVRLHEKCGFRMVGYREKIAQLHGQWRDTILMERRSQQIGL
ncbi:MAG: N-acetyltransferase [Anaerolineae bacterium]|nr:N-acetyltransferase [Anaerolineae bacterium]